MRIAHLISTFLPTVGGAQICVHNIAQRHAGQGHDVVVIAPHEFESQSFGNYPIEGLERGTVFLLKNSFALGRVYFLKQIQFLQQKYDFDLWQITIGYPFGVAVVEYLRDMGKSCVLRCSGEDIQYNAEIEYGIRLDPNIDQLISRTYPQFDATIAISETMAEEYRALRVPEERIHLIPNGVDVRRFRAAKKNQLRDELGIDVETRILLTVGRNHPKKGFASIPKIVQTLLPSCQDFVWLLAGDGCEAIQLMAEEQGCGKYIRCIPLRGLNDDGVDFPSQKLIDIYRLADVFVFPTILETFGIVVIEAMAAGLPVVTTSAPGVVELVEDGVTGFVTTIGDTSVMADRILRLLGDKDLYAWIRQNVINTAGKYDWSVIADKYMEIYQGLLLCTKELRTK